MDISLILDSITGSAPSIHCAVSFWLIGLPRGGSLSPILLKMKVGMLTPIYSIKASSVLSASSKITSGQPENMLFCVLTSAKKYGRFRTANSALPAMAFAVMYSHFSTQGHSPTLMLSPLMFMATQSMYSQLAQCFAHLLPRSFVHSLQESCLFFRQV